MTVTLLWKCNELIVTQQELLRYYSNATTDLTCHNIYIYIGRIFIHLYRLPVSHSATHKLIAINVQEVNQTLRSHKAEKEIYRIHLLFESCYDRLVLMIFV
jgi:hypothetical protein